jgi:hypothetical protein
MLKTPSALILIVVLTAAVYAQQGGGGGSQGRQGGQGSQGSGGARPAPKPVLPPDADVDKDADKEADRKFSPLGFYDLLAYEQAFPGAVGSPEVARANAQKYSAFASSVMRGGGDHDVWLNLGPSTVERSGNASGNISGRVSALAITPRCGLSGGCRLWLGTAGGGVWRTDDAMRTTDPKWKWVGIGLGTNSIGSLAIDPGDRFGNSLYVGTGETNSPNNSGAGTGLYRSTDGADSWSRISTMITDPVVSPAPIDFTSTRGISTIVVDPTNTQTLYVATTTAMLGMTAVRGGQSQVTGYPQPRVGLYKTTNRGQTWTLIWVPPLDPVMPANPNLGVGVGDTMSGVRHVKLDPKDPGIVYATAFNNAIHRSAPSLENGDASFKPIYAIVNAVRFRDLAMFDLAVKNGKTRVYVYNGTEATAPQGFYRLDNADVPAASLVTGSGASLTNTSAWLALSSDISSQSGFTSRRMCSSQCFYDLVVATPPGQPDTVIIGGVAQSTFGQATMRSTNAGVGFSAFGSDAQPTPNQSHVDVRAVAFHPRDPDIAFVGSDGGLVRNDGNFTDGRSRCSTQFTSTASCQVAFASVPTRLYFLNKGLQTLQFYNIALDPQQPLKRMIGGLQDNSTIWQDGTGNPLTWTTLFPAGDGTSASGFHPANPAIVFASFQSNSYFTNFRNGETTSWVRTHDPIQVAAERETVTASTGRQFLTFDQTRPDTQFTAFQHVWRTQTNGGGQAFLEANCKTSGGTSSRICGDWVPLGVAFPFQAGTTPDSPSRKPGDLTSDFYGTDRTGGLIVSAERTPANTGTLWAATNMGRLFVATGVDGTAANVQFVRIDTPVTPNRFVTRIVVDRFDPNVAYISYSGFNALTPGTPGHIFRAVYNPVTQLASLVSADYDIGDIPINTIAFDDVRGDLYAGTDFGPLRLRKDMTHWEGAGSGFPEALMVDLEILPDSRILVGATHGAGIYYLILPKVPAESPAPTKRR